jgi:hypothetical protein
MTGSREGGGDWWHPAPCPGCQRPPGAMHRAGEATPSTSPCSGVWGQFQPRRGRPRRNIDHRSASAQFCDTDAFGCAPPGVIVATDDLAGATGARAAGKGLDRRDRAHATTAPMGPRRKPIRAYRLPYPVSRPSRHLSGLAHRLDDEGSSAHARGQRSVRQYHRRSYQC